MISGPALEQVKARNPIVVGFDDSSDSYQAAVGWFDRWDFWAVFVAGFSPIPYKAFTIAAGALSMALLPFTLASLIGRGARFFLVAGLMAWGGARMEALLHRYIDRLGWATVALVVAGAMIDRG